jgi:hypothetical protein
MFQYQEEYLMLNMQWKIKMLHNKSQTTLEGAKILLFF